MISVKDIASYDSILCDLDGTLINSVNANVRAYQCALAEYKIDVAYDELYKLVGSQRSKEFLKKFTLDENVIRGVIHKKKLHFSRIYNEVDINYPLLNLLKTFKYLGISIGLVTNASKFAVELFLNESNFTSFDVIVCGDDVECGKPDPMPYKLAITKLHSSNNILALEDSLEGVESARAAGLDVLIITFNG